MLDARRAYRHLLLSKDNMQNHIMSKVNANPAELLNTYITKVMEQREEILKAFIVKYRIHPDQVIQVEHKLPSGDIVWFPALKNEYMRDGELTNLALNGDNPPTIRNEVGNVSFHNLVWRGLVSQFRRFRNWLGR